MDFFTANPKLQKNLNRGFSAQVHLGQSRMLMTLLTGAHVRVLHSMRSLIMSLKRTLLFNSSNAYLS